MGTQEQILHLMNLISAIMGGMMIGALCGLLSLIFGFVKKKKLLGFIGFAVSILFGTLMTTVLHQPALLSIIPSAIMTGIIFLVAKKDKKN